MTPRKRTYTELREEGISPSKIPKTVKDKLILANVLTEEMGTLYKKSNEVEKTVICNMLSSAKLKKYKLKNTLSKKTGISTVNQLVRLDEGYFIFRTLRNSPVYLETRKKTCLS